MTLIVHASDIHLGVDRFARSPISEAYLEVLNEIATKTLESKAKYLVLSGDVFHSANPPFDVLIGSLRVFKKLKDLRVRVIVVPGNHDNSPSGRSVLNLLAEAGVINLLDYEEIHGYLISKPLVFEDDNLVFYGIPGFRRSKEIEYLKNGYVKFLDLRKYENRRVVVVAHVSTRIHGYDPSKLASRYGYIATDEGELYRRIPPQTVYVALGHVHIPLPFNREFRGKAAYPGAPIGMDVSDLKETAQLNEKGIGRRVLLVDVSDDPPIARALELENTPLVRLVIRETNTVDELLNLVTKEASDIPGTRKHRVLLFYAKGLEKIDIKVETSVRSISSKYNVYVLIQPMPHSRELSDVLLGGIPLEEVVGSLPDFEDIEEGVLKRLIPMLKVRLDIDKLKWIVNRLSQPITSDVKYEELLSELEKELTTG